MHRARPGAPLTCRECQHRMVPVRSSRGLRFFRHAALAPKCSMTGGESIDHHLLKLELAHAARAAGFFAEYEVSAHDGSWRADVMATSPDGKQRVALEAQLSPIPPEEIQARTTRYEEHGVAVCWFGITPRPWVGSVPSLLVNPNGDKSSWAVSAGIARISKLDEQASFQQWTPVGDVSLADAVAWILSGKMQPHKPLSLAKSVLDITNRQWPSSWTGSTLHQWHIWWTASRYAEIDAQQDREYREQINLAMLRAESPMKAFRARTQIEQISRLKSLVLQQFNNNATRSSADFHIRIDSNYADGLAFYGYRWNGSGTGRDIKPLVVVCPDILGGRRWGNNVPVAFPATYRDQLSGIKDAWLFDLERNLIWAAEPKSSIVSAALASWQSATTDDEALPER
nr:competence protein CoiA family protein [Streptomyces antibioticus]